MSRLNVHKRIYDWIDSRLGITNTALRPAEEHSLNPWYWLGALAATAFICQAVTGALMLLYYVPTVADAYSSTIYILTSVPLGQLLQTIHLYGAYAMVLLVFLHLVRGFFVSVHKKPRELMWVVGMAMGLVVLGLGLTGYLLPWTVVSKSATDVTIGMLSFLPVEIGPLLKFLIAGAGSDADQLRRFFDLHVVVLPGVLLGLLALKMYMFEVHGSAEPSYGAKHQIRKLPWFPNVFQYFTMIGCIFLAMLLAFSALFPLSLPPEFDPVTAASFVPQPEWYFLWLYQMLKFSVFEGPGIEFALGGVTVLLLVLTLLPFLDRGKERNPAARPFFVTLGLTAVAEIFALTVWGYLTPGKVISNSEALTIVLGIVAVIVVPSWITFRARKKFQAEYPSARTSNPWTQHTDFPELGIRRVRLLVAASILPFIAIVTVYLWSVDLLKGQRTFGLLLAAELTAFSMLLHSSSESDRGKFSRPWILFGCVALTALLFLAVAVQ